MKRLLLSLILLSAALTGTAQVVEQAVEPATDSTDRPLLRPSVHPDYVGQDIFVLLHQRESDKGTIGIRQSSVLLEAFQSQVSRNSRRKINGYRTRLYSGNSQDARQRSEEIAAAFSAAHPDIPVYQSYANPFFKVTVGDFRTRDEALFFAASIAGRYPSSFLVREPINYPSLW